MLKLFVSHSSEDTSIVEPLVELIRSGLNLNAEEIRCSSVDGYRLPGGADTDDLVRTENRKNLGENLGKPGRIEPLINSQRPRLDLLPLYTWSSGSWVCLTKS